jgi:hypothetical protein
MTAMGFCGQSLICLPEVHAGPSASESQMYRSGRSVVGILQGEERDKRSSNDRKHRLPGGPCDVNVKRFATQMAVFVRGLHSPE